MFRRFLIIKVYSMSYNARCALDYTLEQGKVLVHTLLWSFDHNFLKYQSLRLCETENVDHIKEVQFRLKFKFGGLKHDLVEVYYLYPEHIVLEEAMLILKFISNNHYDYSAGKPDKLLISNKNIEVAANKWQNLYSMNKDTVNINNLYNYNGAGTFKLKFQFTMLNNINILATVPKHQMSNDFEHLLLDSMYSDVIIRSIDGFEFKVHKGILSSRSKVLKAYFAHGKQNKTLEYTNNYVESHFETEVLKEVLTYIYTDRAPRVHEIPDKILEAAEFYTLPGLKVACEESLHLKLNKDNAIKTLELADLHSATSLKQLTLEFIKDGHAGVVTKTGDWKSIKSIDLLKTLYEFVTSPS